MSQSWRLSDRLLSNYTASTSSQAGRISICYLYSLAAGYSFRRFAGFVTELNHSLLHICICTVVWAIVSRNSLCIVQAAWKFFSKPNTIRRCTTANDSFSPEIALGLFQVNVHLPNAVIPPISMLLPSFTKIKAYSPRYTTPAQLPKHP